MKDTYGQFIKRVKQTYGIDLSLYKEAQMKRRITSLRDKCGFSSYRDYFESMTRDPALLEEFKDRITINVSEFYRNPKRWQILKERIIPFLAEQKQPLTIWSAACSTGEEPYSIAIMMKEHFPNIPYRLIATDLDEKALAQANKGQYKLRALKEVPDNEIEKYFSYNEGVYQVHPILKRHITFKKHDLLMDPYPDNIDLLICRNVLIYFTEEAKDLIYQRFSKALRENGILFVGSTEQIFHPNRYDLTIFDTFFYRKP